MKTAILLLIFILMAAGVSAQGVVTRAGEVVFDGREGSQVNVPITVTGFNNVGAISLKLRYNPSILRYTGIQVPVGSPVLSANDPGSDIALGGMVLLGWFGITPAHLADGAILVNIRFEVVSCGNTEFTWVDDDGGDGCEYMAASTQMPFIDNPSEVYYISGQAVCRSQDPISAYTILGLSEVDLSENNYVQTGSVGAMGCSGRVEIDRNSSVAGPGAFVKAKNICVRLPALVPVQIFEPANVILPEMQWNTTNTSRLRNLNVPHNTTRTYSGNYNDIVIGQNCNVVFSTGTIFGKVNIGKSSKVTFRSGTLNFRRIDLADGTASSPSMMLFTRNVIVLVKDDVTIGKSSQINPAGNFHPVFYIGSSGPSHEFRVKPGGNVTVNASIYAPFGRLHVEGDLKGATYMTGTFIAEKVESKDKNIYWNSFPTAFLSNLKSDFYNFSSDNSESGFLVYPNPSSSSVTCSFKVKTKSLATIDIYTSSGQWVRRAFEGLVDSGDYKSVIVNGLMAPGIYFVQFRTGEMTRMVKLVIE